MEEVLGLEIAIQWLEKNTQRHIHLFVLKKDIINLEKAKIKGHVSSSAKIFDQNS